VSSAEVKEHIDNLKISNVQLSQQDIEMVLDTIVFDGLIEKIAVEKKPDAKMETTPVKNDKNLTSDEEDQDSGNYTYFYRALARLVDSTGVMRVPCGQCPHVHECRPGAVVNPEKCVYFDKWFST
jgi:DNA-directed RNA polymerase III subunit RPC6